MDKIINDSKITLILTTHNRNKYLIRSLEYLSKTEFDVVICDSSRKPIDLGEQFSFAKYEYFPDTDYLSKILAVLLTVKTPYVLLYPDDDFLILQAIETCISFLDSHLEYSSVQGNTVGFSIKRDKVKFAPVYINSYKKVFSENTATERVISLLSDYMHVYYNVFRTEVLKEAFNLTKYNVSNLITNEVFIAVYSLIFGKHKVLPIFYFVREALADSDGTKYDHFEIISTSERYKQEYEWFLDTTAELIVQKDNISKEDALQAIKQGIGRMVQNNNQYNFENKQINEGNKVISLLKKIYRYRIMRAYWVTKKGYPVFFRRYEYNQLKVIKKYINKHKC